jgi:hypothetical protein
MSRLPRVLTFASPSAVGALALLFLPGVTGPAAGDGGPGLGAAREPAAFNPRNGAWEGTARLGLQEVCEARYSQDRLALWWPAERMGCTSPFVLTTEGGGRARVLLSGRPFPAILRYDGERLLICYGDGRHGRPRSFVPDQNTVLLTLRSASPRGP